MWQEIGEFLVTLLAITGAVVWVVLLGWIASGLWSDFLAAAGREFHSREQRRIAREKARETRDKEAATLKAVDEGLSKLSA